MKKLVLLVFGSLDRTGTHLTSCRHFAHEFNNKGFDVRILRVFDRKSYQSLIEILSKRSVYCVHVEQGQLLGLQFRGRNLFDHFDIPVCSQIRDHWFYPWLYPHLKHSPEKSVLIHCDDSFLRLPKTFKGLHLLGSHTVQSIASDYKPNTGNDGKPLFVATCYKVSDICKNIRAKYPQEKNLIDEVYDRSKGKTEIPEEFWKSGIIEGENLILFGRKLGINKFHDLFHLSRQVIRSSFLDVISNFDCNIYVSGSWQPENKTTANINLAHTSKFEIHQKFMNSSLILSDQSAFKSAIGERVASAVFLKKSILMRQCNWSHTHKNILGNIFTFKDHSEIGTLLSKDEVKYQANETDFSSFEGYLPRDILPISYVDKVIEVIDGF